MSIEVVLFRDLSFLFVDLVIFFKKLIMMDWHASRWQKICICLKQAGCYLAKENGDMRRKVLRVLLLVIFMGGFAFSDLEDFRSGVEPDGFRGIGWGTPVTRLNGMHLVWDGGDKKYYEREGDVLEIAGAKLYRIKYTFWKSMFLEVRMDILKNYSDSQDELRNFKTLKEVCFDRFGSRRKRIMGPEEYFWTGSTSWVKLVRDDSGFLYLAMGSAKLLEQKKRYDEDSSRRDRESVHQLAKEGSGF